MIEAICVIGGTFAMLLAVLVLTKVVGHAIARSDAATALESCLDRENVKEVRALLLVRGHLLRPEVRDAANVWLLERENEKKG